jgi:hypothetical protein
MLAILLDLAAAGACDSLTAALPAELAGFPRAAPRCVESMACVSYQRGDDFVTVAVETVLPGKDLLQERAGEHTERFTVGGVPATYDAVADGTGRWMTAANAVVGRRMITVVAGGPKADLAKVAIGALDLPRVAAAFAPCSVALDRAIDVLALLPASIDGMDAMELRNTKLPPDAPVLALRAYGARTRPIRTATLLVQAGPVEPQVRAAVPSWGEAGAAAPDHGGLAIGPALGGWVVDGTGSAAVVAVGERFSVLVTIDGPSAPDAAAQVMRALDFAAMDRVVSRTP